jgi:threonine synthase
MTPVERRTADRVSYFSHLECASGCGAGPFDPHERHFLCPSCSLPLLARYDLDAARQWSRDSLSGRNPDMWRYRELMPLVSGEEPVTLGEGMTPLIHARRLGESLGLARLLIKDESLNPTNSFKARGLSAAITRARSLGATTIALPTAGNAGNAAAAYAAAAGLRCQVFIPKDAKRPFVDECRLYGATVTLVDGFIPDAARVAAEQGRPRGWYDVSTLREPYRVEGKKTMGYELAEQLGWTLAPASSACGRRSTKWSASAGCPRAGGRGWCRSRHQAARRSSGPSRTASRRRRCGSTRTPSRMDCECRAPSATS